MPQDNDEMDVWKRHLRRRLQRFGEERFNWPVSYRKLVFGEEFTAATLDFARAAREFDASIELAEVGQAMRNVWIANSLQSLMGAPVELNRPIFAYSMLYPYTDNLLDDPDLPTAAKEGMNARLERWLRGAPAVPASERERQIRELVRIIERNLPRAEFGEVYDSLLAIHHGQIRSLRLQGNHGSVGDVLSTQIEKGGTSVLADGYLALGRLDPAEEDFCFGYGVFLQMLDDLQDAESDRVAGHGTLFSLAEGPADGLVSRLWHYMHCVVDEARGLGSPQFAECRDLILRNCTVLLVGAVAEYPQLVSRRFRRHLERRWPLGLRSMRALRRFAGSTLRESRERLERTHDLESLWGLLDRRPTRI